MNIPPEVLKAVEESFLESKYPKTVKTRPCRIKFNGKFITTCSKKTVWRNKAFAKSALLNHLRSGSIAKAINKYILNKQGPDRNLTSVLGSYELKTLRDELEKQGIIEFVEVDMEDFAIQKNKT
jgi:hypothetical protein